MLHNNYLPLFAAHFLTSPDAQDDIICPVNKTFGIEFAAFHGGNPDPLEFETHKRG